MRSSLELHLSPHLTLTPQIVQAIRVLQLSAADLEHEIEESLATNPLLERGTPAAIDEAPMPATGSTDPAADAAPDLEAPPAGSANADSGDDEVELRDPWVGPARRATEGERDFTLSLPARTSLRDHLLEQLAGSRLRSTERLMVEAVIAGLDEDGYLRQSADDLLRPMPLQIAADGALFEFAVRYVQSLDPPGVAARSLAECLALQLERRPVDADSPGAHTHALALRIVREHLDLLALHDAPALARELACDEESVRRANMLIRALNPRPGAAFGEMQPRYVVADVIVRKSGGKWVAAINPSAVPAIRVNRLYAAALQRSRDAACPLAQYLQDARRLVRNVQQRFDTIQRVAQVIVDRQRMFFEVGELALRPLVLRDVARELGLHPSTVSRASSNKYAQTPAGLFELKHFFSTRASQSGTTCSAAAIRALIRELVAAESPQDPVSDVQITRLLAGRGITVARRTVAKYRAALQIAPVESRRMTVDGAVARRLAAARPIAALAARRTDEKRQAAHRAAAE
jgi:RNA polymerase sigma-54 factor